MKRKRIYPLLVLLIGAAFIIYEEYNKAGFGSDKAEDTEQQTTSNTPKKLTNEFYLAKFNYRTSGAS